MSSQHAVEDVPPVPSRLSNALAQRDWHRGSWETVIEEEISSYACELRQRGVTPERAVLIVKEIARPLVSRSERFATKIVGWVADAYFR